MIIAISSPPPFDKSDLAERLAAQHNLKIVEDPAPAMCREYGFQTLYDMPAELQTEIRERLIRDHAAFVKANDNVVVKFSIFEFLSDWMRWAWANTPTEKWEEIMSIASKVVERYDEIYHLEDGKRLEYDGYIWFDQRNANQINNLLKGLYVEMNVTGKIK